MVEDTYKHQGLRKKLIDGIREKGITNEKVLDAMMKIPRHIFMDNAFLQFAYEDQAFPIGSGQTISQPYTVAFQTALLEVNSGDTVLEIGTGSGYQTCVLEEMGIQVYSVERQRALFDKTKALLRKMKYKAQLHYGDGYAGLVAFAPFDGILVTCGAPFIPEALKSQLKIGGRLVIPVGEGDVQEMFRITRTGEDSYKEENFGQFRFVPMLKDKAVDR